jgi:hypothetical protein
MCHEQPRRRRSGLAASLAHSRHPRCGGDHGGTESWRPHPRRPDTLAGAADRRDAVADREAERVRGDVEHGELLLDRQADERDATRDVEAPEVATGGVGEGQVDTEWVDLDLAARRTEAGQVERHSERQEADHAQDRRERRQAGAIEVEGRALDRALGAHVRAGARQAVAQGRRAGRTGAAAGLDRRRRDTDRQGRGGREDVEQVVAGARGGRRATVVARHAQVVGARRGHVVGDLAEGAAEVVVDRDAGQRAVVQAQHGVVDDRGRRQSAARGAEHVAAGAEHDRVEVVVLADRGVAGAAARGGRRDIREARVLRERHRRGRCTRAERDARVVVLGALDHRRQRRRDRRVDTWRGVRDVQRVAAEGGVVVAAHGDVVVTGGESRLHERGVEAVRRRVAVVDVDQLRDAVGGQDSNARVADLPGEAGAGPDLQVTGRSQSDFEPVFVGARGVDVAEALCAGSEHGGGRRRVVGLGSFRSALGEQRGPEERHGRENQLVHCVRFVNQRLRGVEEPNTHLCSVQVTAVPMRV